MFLILNPKQRIILDATDEKADELERIKRQEMRATMAKAKALKSPRNTEFDSEGNIQDNTFFQTQRSMASSKKTNQLSARSADSKKRTPEEEVELEELLKQDLNPSEDSKKQAQTNRDVPIDEYLLYFTFLRIENSNIPEEALSIITQSIRQKELLMEEVCKV